MEAIEYVHLEAPSPGFERIVIEEKEQKTQKKDRIHELIFARFFFIGL